MFACDADGDGQLSPGGYATAVQCTAPVLGCAGLWVEESTLPATDCDDTNGAVYFNATETCNGVDDDCDTLIDDGVKTTYACDADGDGQLSDSVYATAADCAPPGTGCDGGVWIEEATAAATDCDDANGGVQPGRRRLRRPGGRGRNDHVRL